MSSIIKYLEVFQKLNRDTYNARHETKGSFATANLFGKNLTFIPLPKPKKLHSVPTNLNVRIT